MPRDLVHLQPGIVRVPDHDLSFAQVARRGIGGLRKLPQSHLADAGLVGGLAGRGRTAARGFHVGLDDIELAVGELGDRVHVGVGVDAHTGRDRRNHRVRSDIEGRGDGRGVFVDHDGEGFDAARIARRQRGANGQWDDRGVLGADRHLDGDQARAVGERPVVEYGGGELGPGILLCCLLGKRAERGKADSTDHEAGHACSPKNRPGHRPSSSKAVNPTPPPHPTPIRALRMPPWRSAYYTPQTASSDPFRPVQRSAQPRPAELRA